MLTSKPPSSRRECFSTKNRLCSYVRVGSAKAIDQRPDAQNEGAFLPQSAARVPAVEKALLGASLLGQGLFFDHQRCNHRGRCTSVPATAYPKSYRRQTVVV